MKTENFGLLRRSWDKFRYWRYVRRAKKIQMPASGLRRVGFTSQHGQDLWVSTVLAPTLNNGVFVDIGAHDGQSLSNTYFLEKRLGWTGIAIEPIPERFAELKRNRGCICLQGCISGKKGISAFNIISGDSEMLSGIPSQYDRRHKVRIAKEIEQRGGKHLEIVTQTFTLNEILESNGLHHVDYVSMDVEGSELDILGAFDFDRFDVKIFGIENNYQDPRIPKLMRSKGYVFHSVVGDEFYVRPQHSASTK